MTIGQSIKKVRIDKGYTIKALSIETGIRATTIGNWERDIFTPTVILLCCVADALKVSLDELCGRSTEKSSTIQEKEPTKEPTREHKESLTGKERKYRIMAKRPEDKKWSPWNDTNDINKVVEIVNRVKELGYMVEVRD